MAEQKEERPTAPTVEIELDKKRRLRFDFNAFSLAEKETGKNFLSGVNWTALSAIEVRAILWAGLVWDDPTLTVEDVGAMLYGPVLTSIMEKLVEAFEAAFPVQTSGSKKKQKS